MPSPTKSRPDDAADLRPVPSQAEGEDRDKPENTRAGGDTRPRPSQAEGDEQTIDESLRRKEKQPE